MKQARTAGGASQPTARPVPGGMHRLPVLEPREGLWQLSDLWSQALLHTAVGHRMPTDLSLLTQRGRFYRFDGRCHKVNYRKTGENQTVQ